MEPTPKRPRLSMFHPEDSGRDLAVARYGNDMALKTKWEAIFAKYSRDFTDVGDEIDIITGDIIVNRGHLEGMKTESDPGRFDGNSLLRFISDAQANGEYYPGTDQVLQSIESVAENAAHKICDSTSLSEDCGSRETTLAPYNSDGDSLFASDRESSVDSLFNISSAATNQIQIDTDSPEAPENDAIIAKFGPDVGQEVLEILEKHRQAHIEPAWRLPISIEQIIQAPIVIKLEQPISSSPSPVSDPDPERSIWFTALSPTRSESEDPLQEDFIPPQKRSNEHYSSDGYVEDDENGPEPSDLEMDTLMELVQDGECVFCHKKYGSKASVMAHWDRVLKNSSKSNVEDDHDYALLRKVRSRATRRVRHQRLTVGDFRTMVEFHEGASLSFDDIATSRVLRTRKTGPQLQHIYHQHRTVPHERERSEPVRTWSIEDEGTILSLIQNPLSTMTTLRRAMKHRTELEIGNHLADAWLHDMQNTQDGQKTV